MAEKIATREAYGSALAEFGYKYNIIVFDADLAEATKTIKLDYIEKTDDAVTEIKVVKCEGNELQLDFGGEILTFTK